MLSSITKVFKPKINSSMMGFWQLVEKIQLIQHNNAHHKVLSEVTAQLTSNILVLPPMNCSQQAVVIWNCTTVPIGQRSKNKFNLTITWQ